MLGVAKLSGGQTSLPITSRQAAKSCNKSKKLHRNSVLNLLLDKASVTVIDYTMSVWMAFAILLTYLLVGQGPFRDPKAGTL